MDVLRGQTGFFDGVSVFVRFANGTLEFCYMGGSTLNTARTLAKCVLVWRFVLNSGAKCVEIQYCV